MEVVALDKLGATEAEDIGVHVTCGERRTQRVST